MLTNSDLRGTRKLGRVKAFVDIKLYKKEFPIMLLNLGSLCELKTILRRRSGQALNSSTARTFYPKEHSKQ